MNQILMTMQEICPGIDMAGVKKKIHGLRTQYRKELRNMTSTKKSGAGADEIVSPKWVYFNDLNFLNEGEAIRESTSSLDCTQMTTITGESVQYYSQDTVSYIIM